MTTIGQLFCRAIPSRNSSRADRQPVRSVLGILVVVAGLWEFSAGGAPAHPHPYLMPPAEKARLLERVRSTELGRKQYDAIKERAAEGKVVEAALVFALEGEAKPAETVRRHLLQHVRSRGPSLDEDIAAGGHRERNMEFYWDTADIRAYDLVYAALSADDRKTIETFYRKLGRYWRDSLSRWTTTPNLVFPIHYHAAVIGYCLGDEELIEWGLRDKGGRFGPTRGGLFPVLDAMLRDGTIWDEATIYAAVNVLQPMMQLAIVQKLYDGKQLFTFASTNGGSIKKLVDGYIALTYPRERTGVGPGSFQIATYGDGSTENPYSKHHNTDAIYLVNLPWARGDYRHELVETIEQAYYLTRAPAYAWFLSHEVEREPSFLYGETIPFGSVEPPPAPSSVFPEAGIAMLRADESPGYWTNGSMAVLQMMSRGYGHDHRDKMMILLHAGGRLLYPDLNCVQYEPPSINWTASSVAHNTLVVDRGKTANAPFTYRHAFAPEVKFLATTASCYPGVQQTRVLALTREYLLDLFWANSDVTHTYDWVLHAIGKLQLDDRALYRPSADLLRDYWWIENEVRRNTAETWRADFVQQNGLAIPGLGRQTREWFDDVAAVRVLMAGEAGTTVYGGEGPTGGPPVDGLMNPEGNSPMLVVRRECPRTVFAAVHEPYKLNAPSIAFVRPAAVSEDAYLAEIVADQYVDRIAATFGEQKSNAIHLLRSERDPQEAIVFRDHAYLRQTSTRGATSARLVARGAWLGFRLRCPQIREGDSLVMNGTNSPFRKEGEYVVFGDIAKTLEGAQPNTKVGPPETRADPSVANLRMESQPSTVNFVAMPEPMRLAVRDERRVHLALRNESRDPQTVRIRLRLPQGVSAATSSSVTRQDAGEGWNYFQWEILAIAPLLNADIPVDLSTDGRTKPGLHAASMQVTGTTMETWTTPVALPIAIGPVLLEDNSFPTFGEYVVYAPRYTLRLSKRYGTSRFLRDAADRPRYEATFWDRRPTAATTPDALPRVRINEQDVLAWGDPAQFIWPTTVPAAVTIGTGRSRLAWSFEDEAVRIEPVALWSTEAAHEFIFPGDRMGWTSWGERPRWVKIIAANDTGEEQTLTRAPAGPRKIWAALLQTAGHEEAICFAVDRPQVARFNGASLHLNVHPGEPLWFGLSAPSRFEQWARARREK